MKENILRTLVGGAIVSAFSLLGDLLKPKSFAGLFGAAPSVALAAIVLTVMTEDKAHVSIETRSMILGAVAFFLYAFMVSQLLIRRKLPALPVTSVAILLWFACAFGLWYVVLALHA